MKKFTDVSVEKIGNGFLVCVSFEEKEEDKETDFGSEKVFRDTVEKAMVKVKELVEKLDE